MIVGADSQTLVVLIGAVQVVLLALIAAWVRTRPTELPSPIEAEVTLMDPAAPAAPPEGKPDEVGRGRHSSTYRGLP